METFYRDKQASFAGAPRHTLQKHIVEGVHSAGAHRYILQGQTGTLCGGQRHTLHKHIVEGYHLKLVQPQFNMDHSKPCTSLRGGGASAHGVIPQAYRVVSCFHQPMG